jgi:hypothetical protein
MTAQESDWIETYYKLKSGPTLGLPDRLSAWIVSRSRGSPTII